MIMRPFGNHLPALEDTEYLVDTAELGEKGIEKERDSKLVDSINMRR